MQWHVALNCILSLHKTQGGSVVTDRKQPTFETHLYFPESWCYKARVTQIVSWLKCEPDAQVSEKVK